MGRFTLSTLNSLEPSIHSIIKEGLGFSEPTLLESSMNVVQQGGGIEEITSMYNKFLMLNFICNDLRRLQSD